VKRKFVTVTREVSVPRRLRIYLAIVVGAVVAGVPARAIAASRL